MWLVLSLANSNSNSIACHYIPFTFACKFHFSNTIPVGWLWFITKHLVLTQFKNFATTEEKTIDKVIQDETGKTKISGESTNIMIMILFLCGSSHVKLFHFTCAFRIPCQAAWINLRTANRRIWMMLQRKKKTRVENGWKISSQTFLLYITARLMLSSLWASVCACILP